MPHVATSFEFVDYFDTSARQRSRSHVLKEHYRRQREQRLHQYVATTQSFVFEFSDSKPGKAAPTHSKPQTSKLRILTSAAADNGQAYSSPANTNANFRPQSLLGAGRVDPFQSYPIAASCEIHQLVDHYIFFIPSLLRKRWLRDVKVFTPAADLFTLYRRHKASFLGMLYHASYHHSRMRNIADETPETIRYKILALKTINESIDGSSKACENTDDGITLAVGLLASAERMWGDLETSLVHRKAYANMISQRADMCAFYEDKVLYTKLQWTSIALTGAANGFHDHGIEYFLPRNVLESVAQQGCRNLLSLFMKRKAIMLRALPTSEAEHEYRSVAFARRCGAFMKGTILRHMLSRPTVAEGSCTDTRHPTARRKHGLKGRKRQVEDNCRFAIILFLCQTMAEYGDFSKITANFLRALEERLQDERSDINLSPEFLLWSLLQGIVSASERCAELWSRVSGMMAASRFISESAMPQLEEVFLLLLEMPDIHTKPMDDLLASTQKVLERHTLMDGLRDPADKIENRGYLADKSASPRPPLPNDAYCELLWHTAFEG